MKAGVRVAINEVIGKSEEVRGKAPQAICGCGELYEPQHDKDKICSECRYFLRALHSKNIFFVEQLRAEYIKRYGRYISYGQFVAKLEQIERRRIEE